MRVCRGLPSESRFQPGWTAAKVAQVFAVPAASRVANVYVWFRLRRCAMAAMAAMFHSYPEANANVSKLF